MTRPTILVLAVLAAGCGRQQQIVDAQQENISAQQELITEQQEHINELQKSVDIVKEYREEMQKTRDVGWECVRQRDESERRFNRLAVKALAAGLIDGPEVLGFPFKTVNGRPFVKVVNSDQWNELEWPSHDEADHIDLYYGNHPDKRMRAIYLNGQWHSVVIDVESPLPSEARDE